MLFKNLLLPLAALLAACTAAPAPAPQARAELSSPDGKLRMAFYLSEAGTPYYSLEREGTAVLTPGRLGFTMAPGGGFGISFERL